VPVCLKTGFNLCVGGGVYRADLFVEGKSLFAVANTLQVPTSILPDLVAITAECRDANSRTVKVLLGREIEIEAGFLHRVLEINPTLRLSSLAHDFVVVGRPS